ncbi:Uncharacterized protein Fot_52613 [Forsythia ovata]|uniref:Uncharacterized protein n=1 Tax=Forsythia ovata TaxID=205694 RepID=A0ABD1PL74_9LAMI
MAKKCWKILFDNSYYLQLSMNRDEANVGHEERTFVEDVILRKSFFTPSNAAFFADAINSGKKLNDSAASSSGALAFFAAKQLSTACLGMFHQHVTTRHLVQALKRAVPQAEE